MKDRFNLSGGTDNYSVLNSLWKGKWWIFCTILSCTALAGSFLYRMQNIYQAEVVLAPAEEKSPGTAGLGQRLSGLAGLAGIDFGQGGVDKATLGLETINSRVFLTDFIRKHDVLIPLFATKKWDMASNDWEIDAEIYDVAEKKWIREVREPRKSKPSDWEAYEEFKNTISVSQNLKTGIVKLSLRSKSPRYAKEWASLLVEDLNNYMRERDVKEAKKSIKFLEHQLEKISVGDMQSILYQLIEQQMKIIMLAEVREGYVFRVIDPPVIPEKQFAPRRGIILAVIFIVSGIFSSFFVVVRNLPSSRLHMLDDATK